MGGLSTRCDAISTFEDGGIDVAQLQSRLDALAATRDSSYADIVDELRNVDAGLEGVIFGIRTERQCLAGLEVLAGLWAVVDVHASDAWEPTLSVDR
jgi:hypothetical protein